MGADFSALRVNGVVEIAPAPIECASPPVPAGRGLGFLLLTMVASVAIYARFAVGPLQESIRIALSLSDSQMALLQGPALALPMAFAAIPLGLVVDRYSRVRLLLIFAALNLIGSVSTALASSFTLLFLARCLVGLAVAAISATAFSLVADLYAPAQRGRAMTVLAIGQYAGMSAAFALGGTLVAMSGSDPNGWRWAMFWLTGPLLLVIFAMLAMREPVRVGRAIGNPSLRDTCVELWRYRAVIMPLMAGLVMAEIAVLAALTWAAPALSRTFALPPDRVGTIMAMTLLLSGVLGPMTGGILADLCQRTGGPRRTMSVLSALALLCAPAGLFAVMPGVASAGVLLVAFKTIVGAILVMGIALFTVVIPNELRGLCMAALAGAQVLLGVGLAPIMVSLLSGAMGGPTMIGKALSLVCIAASLLGTAMFALGRRCFPRSVF